MGKAGLHLLNKLKAGQKSAVDNIKEEKLNKRFDKNNLDLINLVCGNGLTAKALFVRLANH